MKTATVNGVAPLAKGRTGVAGNPASVAVPLVLEGPCASGAVQPVTIGVPFPRGVLTDDTGLVLFDSLEQPVPLQTLPLAWWPDGSIKWLLLDFVQRQTIKEIAHWQLAHDASHNRPSGRPDELRILESPGRVVVETGAASFELDASAGPLPARACLAGTDLLQPRSNQIVLTDRKGRCHKPRIERVVVEARGPVRATIRCEGFLPRCRSLRFVARTCFFAGTGLMRFRFAIHNPNRARHRGGIWDLGDPGSFLFRDLSLIMPLAGATGSFVSWTAEAGQPPVSEPLGSLEIYQDSSGGENWQSKNHVNSRGEVPCSFRGYRVQSEGREAFGLRASPLVFVRGISVAVPEFWQQFPKAIEVDGSCLRVRLFPEQFGDPFELQGGERKTHTVWFDFVAAGTRALDWVHQPVKARSTPEWYARTSAVPFLQPGSPDDDARFQELLAEISTGDKSLVARREIIDEYGWRNFGEIYADHEAAYYQGPPPIISHYNNQYDVVYGALLQYLRTGDPAWVAIFDPLARHVMDIDVYHTTQDKASYNGGLFWHTDHYRSAFTATHRAYTAANRPGPGADYGGGPANEHNYSIGLLHYYYLTGDRDARDAVIGLADWVINREDGRKNLFGIVDDGPTGLSSCTTSLEYQGPGRGCGNSVNALLNAWLLTGTRKYLDSAEQLIRRTIHPAEDVAAWDLLNVEARWSYTVFLSALARYLNLKAEAGELDDAYAYAQASLVHYARWMLDHESPYFDHPEKLEYPTETWAAQELRKANVLRLAAGHADEPFRSRLLSRGGELAERAWSDLWRFSTRAAARPAAILLTEAATDALLRHSGPLRLPRSLPTSDFGRPAEFVPQRIRVMKQLKSVRGLARAALRVADARRWYRLWSSSKP